MTLNDRNSLRVVCFGQSKTIDGDGFVADTLHVLALIAGIGLLSLMHILQPITESFCESRDAAKQVWCRLNKKMWEAEHFCSAVHLSTDWLFRQLL